MHRYRVLSPECVSRKDGDESRSRSTFRPWLQFQKSSRGRAKTRFPRLPCFQTSSVHVINDDQSGREMLLERGYALWRDVVAYGSHVFRKSIFINDLVIHTYNIVIQLIVFLRFILNSKLWSMSYFEFYIFTYLGAYLNFNSRKLTIFRIFILLELTHYFVIFVPQ